MATACEYGPIARGALEVDTVVLAIVARLSTRTHSGSGCHLVAQSGLRSRVPSSRVFDLARGGQRAGRAVEPSSEPCVSAEYNSLAAARNSKSRRRESDDETPETRSLEPRRRTTVRPVPRKRPNRTVSHRARLHVERACDSAAASATSTTKQATPDQVVPGRRRCTTSSAMADGSKGRTSPPNRAISFTREDEM